jgi:hypothetical protein
MVAGIIPAAGHLVVEVRVAAPGHTVVGGELAAALRLVEQPGEAQHLRQGSIFTGSECLFAHWEGKSAISEFKRQAQLAPQPPRTLAYSAVLPEGGLEAGTAAGAVAGAAALLLPGEHWPQVAMHQPLSSIHCSPHLPKACMPGAGTIKPPGAKLSSM